MGGNLLALAALSVPYIIIVIMTDFEKRSSTLSQRVWIMLWIVTGQVAPICVTCVVMLMRKFSWWRESSWLLRNSLLGLLVPAASFGCVGGFVVVVKMIHEFGVCATV
jgi:cytochrome c biogenesis protein CcdA